MDERYLPFYGGAVGGAYQPALYAHLNGYGAYGMGYGVYGAGYGCCSGFGNWGLPFGFGGYGLY